MALYLQNLESPFVPSVVESGPVFCRWFLNTVNVFSLFCYYLPLEKGVPLHLNKFKSPSPKATWLKLAQWFWRRKWKCEKWKVNRQMDKGKLKWANKRRKYEEPYFWLDIILAEFWFSLVLSLKHQCEAWWNLRQVYNWHCVHVTRT